MLLISSWISMFGYWLGFLFFRQEGALEPFWHFFGFDKEGHVTRMKLGRHGRIVYVWIRNWYSSSNGLRVFTTPVTCE